VSDRYQLPEKRLLAGQEDGRKQIMDTSSLHTIVSVRKLLAKFRNTFARESICLEKDMGFVAPLNCRIGQEREYLSKHSSTHKKGASE